MQLRSKSQRIKTRAQTQRSWALGKYPNISCKTFIWQGINEVGHALSISSSCGIWPLRSAAAAGMGMLLPTLGNGLYKLRQRQQQQQGSWALGSGILFFSSRGHILPQS